MSRTNCLSLALAFVWLLSVVGCGQSKPAPIAETKQVSESDSAKTPVTNEIPSATATAATAKPQVALVATAEEGTAESTFQRTLIAFQEGRLDTAFEFLPPSFQADVENVVHEFAEKMDPEVWSKSFELLTKIANILKTKKNLILGLDNVKRLQAVDSIKPHWDAIASGVYEVATSEVADVNNLKTCDVKRLLAAGSGLLAGMPLPKFGDVSVTTLNSSSDTATLSYRETKDSEAKPVEFVKIEGKWLPKSIAGGWAASIAEARSRLSELPSQVAAVKPIFIQQFDSVNGMLDQVQQAKTSDEFNGALMQLILPIALGKGMAEQAIRDSVSKPQAGGPIHVVINRELTDAEQTKLRDAVTMGDQNVDYEFISNDGKTRARFNPVADGEAVVAALTKHFDGATVQLDPATKTIRVELK